MKKPSRSRTKSQKLKEVKAFKGILKAISSGTVIRGGQSDIVTMSNVVIDNSKVSVIKAKDNQPLKIIDWQPHPYNANSEYCLIYSPLIPGEEK